MRGYGHGWQQRRRMYEGIVALGRVKCARCGQTILAGQAWDLGHVDGTNKTQVAGPEHASCNRATSRHRIRRVSQEW